MKFNIKNVAHFRFPEKTQFPKYDRQSKCIWTVLISRIILYLYHLVELVRIVLILKEEVEVFKKENGPEIGFKKGYLKISRSMSKSEFTEWIFHRCIHYFQVKYALALTTWYDIQLEFENHTVARFRNEIMSFFQQARQRVIWRHNRHLIKSSEFGNLIKTVARELVYVPAWPFPIFFAKSKKNLIPIHYIHFHMPLIRNFTFPTRKKNIFLTDLFTSHPYTDCFFVFFW